MRYWVQIMKIVQVIYRQEAASPVFTTTICGPELP